MTVTGVWSMLENGGKSPESVIIWLLSITIRSKRFSTLSVTRVGLSMTWTRSNPSRASFNLMSNGDMVLCLYTCLLRNMLPALKSPKMIVAASESTFVLASHCQLVCL